MPFPYGYICDLLQQLEIEIRKPKTKQTPGKLIIAQWFDEHCALLYAPGNDACAILSTLLPERRTDRVYCIQAPRLQSIIGQAFLLGASRVKELRRYQTPGLGVNLGECVEGILKRTPNPDWGTGVLTVEEIDSVLGEIASACRFSSPAVRASRNNRDLRPANEALTSLYKRLSARDAKWFTRLVLKSYEPILLDHSAVFRSYHRLLPQMLKIRDDFTVAAEFLRYMNGSSDDQARVASMLKPKLGMKVGRQLWLKARSINHCLEMGRGRIVSCEQKLDGEYCQVHIDLSRGYQCIQIFSKSGKDSTQDRVGLHSAIRESLKIGGPDCPIKQGCILEGELVVYSTEDHKILPFHKIRKHVSRSGSFIGTRLDSQRHDHEHLMIVYFDVLMIDDESLLGLRQSERMKRLTNLITCRTGYSATVQRQVISLSRLTAAEELREAFAKCIVRRSEGLVLKPDEPYFDFSADRESYTSCNIKLKKEYVQGWGDVGDFAVVGASYDPVKAKTYRIPNLKWTHFFIGCLDDRDQSVLGMQRPRFMVLNVVELNETMLQTVVTHCSHPSVPFNEDTTFDLDLLGLGSGKPPGVLFLEPMVFDVRCFSFEKAPNTNFLSMRFPMVSKVHFDRSWREAITFTELQEAATAATEMPQDEDSQEMRDWITALEKVGPRRIVDDSSSQRSCSSGASLSPRAIDSTAMLRGETLGTIVEESKREQVSLIRETSPTVLTPPMSSAMTPTRGESSLRKRGGTSPTRGGSTKRVHEPGSCTPRAKRPRRESHGPRSGSSTPVKIREDVTSPVRKRQPLAKIEQNMLPTEQGSPRNKNPDRTPSSPASEARRPTTAKPPVCASSSPARSFYTAPGPPSSPPANNARSEQDTLRQEKPPTASTRHAVQSSNVNPGACPVAGLKCAFAGYSLLLSPCISTYAWVTDNLLRGHGIGEFLVDPAAWHRDGGEAETGGQAARHNGIAPGRRQRRTRARKICLVESRRREATEAFLQEVERAGPRTRDGAREWVAVYDWRLLESVAEEESGRTTALSPWRRWYVGVA
ncbi:hypothetical protein F5X99DRAFT_428676 [Biscogniauxia marginata]|nr:hypothetical protein F5X99DRAFT_428676 [Biscogniauxia marginata]